MVDFKKGMYEQEFKYEDNEGVEQSIILKPMPAKYLTALFSVVKKFQGKGQENFLDSLDDDTVDKLVDMCIVTMKKSYPTMSEEDVDGFVSSNFFALFPAVIELNLQSGKNK